jgi:hypothetical protein
VYITITVREEITLGRCSGAGTDHKDSFSREHAGIHVEDLSRRGAVDEPRLVNKPASSGTGGRPGGTGTRPGRGSRGKLSKDGHLCVIIFSIKSASGRS